MNPIVLYFADGTSYFVGLTVVGLTDFLLLHFHKRPLRPVFTVLALIGMVFVVISSTPLPYWAYALWFIPAVGSLILGNLGKSSRNLRIMAEALILVTTVVLCLVEAPYHVSPTIIVPNGETVYVLGDSISAGMGSGERCWPAALKEVSGLSVVNLALAGATVQSAIQQAKGISHPHSVVIVEIGGNDLLGGTDASIFRSQLESLISSLRRDKHDVLMLELPLLPFQNAFGKAQRDIAAKYGVTLLPKRFLTKVLGLTGGTLDGLHLSQEGHNALAVIIAGSLEKQSNRTAVP